MTDDSPTLAQELSATIAWWQAAGVDSDFADDATAWVTDGAADDSDASANQADRSEHNTTADAEPPQHDAQSPTIVRVDLLGESPPQSLDEFHDFWLKAPGIDGIGPRGRVPPRGAHGAKLMILVIDPEEHDRDALLSGPQGQLLTNFLSAAGLNENEIYLASALPRHTPMADTSAIAAGGMDAVVAYHIQLVAPERVLAFGGNILPLIGHELPKDLASLREINLVTSPRPLLVSEGLDAMLSMPQLKARFWRRWSEWSADPL